MSRGLAFFSMAMLLSGCMQGMTGDGSLSERLSSARLGLASEQNEDTTTIEPSAIIQSLQSRSSAIRPGTAYATIAAATLASDARVAEAELRAARLRSAATDKNWMPSIGPAISLTSLGDMVANLVVEAVIFDNGKKKAERAMARAEVEVAAVSLVSDGNERVYEALDLYLTALEGGESQRLSREALLDMRRFRWIMNERVKGGVSDMSDLTILAQKIAEIESSMKDAQDKRDTALAELSAMTDRDLSGLNGIGALDMSAGNSKHWVLLLQRCNQNAIRRPQIWDVRATYPVLWQLRQADQTMLSVEFEQRDCLILVAKTAIRRWTPKKRYWPDA